MVLQLQPLDVYVLSFMFQIAVGVDFLLQKPTSIANGKKIPEETNNLITAYNIIKNLIKTSNVIECP